MILNSKELGKYYNTTNIGTEENPKVEKLKPEYKIALFLGFTLKWKYSIRTSRIIYNKERTYYLEPVFKKSRETFCFCHIRDWHFTMIYILPKIKEDNLMTEKLKNLLLNFDLKEVIKETTKILDKKIKDIENPFNNIKEFVEK
jgi:hypothetical protein